jgi:hypothetical protein
VFAAGVVLWEAIAQRQLVRGKPSPQVFEARITGTEPRISQIMPELDPALARICDRAMAVDVEERYPSAEALRQELADYLAERKLSYDAAAIAQVLRSKFADERSSIHRLIEDQLRQDEDVTHSFISARDPLLFAPATRSFPPGAETPDAGDERESALVAKRGAPRVKRWLVGACALAAVAALVRVQRDDGEQGAGRAATSATTNAGSTTTPAASAPAPAPAPRDRKDERTVKEPSDTPARLASPLKAASSAAPAPAATTHNAHALSPPPRDASVDSPLHIEPARAVPAPEPMDVDLHRLGPPRRRALDVENPFR